MTEGPHEPLEPLDVHEERLRVRRTPEVTGTVRVRREIEGQPVEESIERHIERARVRRVPPNEGDSGKIERLPDGSISIPVLEEQLVVKKRTVVRERLLITKEETTRTETIRDTLRRERVSVERLPGSDKEISGSRRSRGVPSDDPETP
jgi:uncharacterized protein (TIGR02271 family)